MILALEATELLTFKKNLLFAFCFFLFSSLAMCQELQLNEVVSSNSTILSPSTQETYDWIELYNNSENTFSLDGYFLSDELDNPTMWGFPAGLEISANSYFTVWLSGNSSLTSEDETHANFKISSDGESIYLYDGDAVLIDNSPSLEIQPDLSIGRISENSDWFYLDIPSPGSENLAENAFPEEASLPLPSNEGGINETPFTLNFELDNDEDVIRYTTDFSEPNEDSEAITGNLFIYLNTTIKLKVYRENALQSEILTLSYLFSEEDLSLDVISITAPAENLFGGLGIYDNESNGAEVEASFELFENGQTVISQNVGIKIHSPDTRDQLGFRIYARSAYGENRFNHPIFSQKELSSFKTLILRNGGNDGAELEETHFRDALGHELYLELNPENGMACYKPVNVFLNGEYWGIYNLRERQDEYYLEDNYDVSPESVDFLEYDFHEENHMKTISGDWDNWNELQNFVLDNDLSISENFQTIDDWVDLDNFIDYQLFQIAIGNQDWCNNNIKFWRPIADGKWKWVMWDVEYGFGTFGSAPVGSPEFNFFGMAITWGGWNNGDYTWLFRKLLENTDFRTRFITRTQDLLNTSFRPSHLEQNIAAKIELIEDDIPYQFDKWGSSLGEWETSIDELLFYIDQRGYYLLENISQWYDFDSTTHEIEIDISEQEAGTIKLNTILLDNETIGAQENTFPWNGIYYGTQQLNIEALENPGYTFSHWEGDLFSEDAAITVYLVDDFSITAVYETFIDPIPDYSALVINELMSSNQTVYQDEFGESEDWIELYNSGSEPIDLSGFYLSDNANDLLKYEIPNSLPEMLLAPNDHIVFYADDNAAQGNLHTNFRLDNDGEEVLISHEDENLEVTIIDQIEFDAIPSDYSFGRISDANSDWITFDVPTPNELNETIGNIATAGPLEEISILVYPNPSADLINFSIQTTNHPKFSQIRILSMEGKESLTIEKPTDLFGIDISSLPSGVYCAEFTQSNKDSKSRVKFVKL